MLTNIICWLTTLISTWISFNFLPITFLPVPHAARENRATPGLRGPTVPSQSNRHRGERRLLGDPGHKSKRKNGNWWKTSCRWFSCDNLWKACTYYSKKLLWMLLSWWEHYVLASSTLQSWSSAWLTWTSKWTLQVCKRVQAMGLVLVWGKASKLRYKHSTKFISCISHSTHWLVCRCLLPTCLYWIILTCIVIRQGYCLNIPISRIWT